MILMWLGSFVLMMFGLSESQKHLAAFFAPLQKKFLDKGLDTEFKSMLIRALDVVILEASPQKSLYSGMALYNLRIIGLRPAYLVMCASILGSWWVLALGLLFLNFNGFFLLGLCVFGLFNLGNKPRLEVILRWIFAAGVFLVGSEMMLRNSSVIQTLLGQSDLAFLLADGRFGAVLVLFLVGVLLSFVVRLEFWSLALGLSLIVTSTLSFNGALGLLAGERVGRMLLFWWRTRSLSQDCRYMGQKLSLFSILGVVVGFWVAGEMRNMFYFEDKTLHLVLSLAVILFGQFVGQMAWGHFASQAKAEALSEAKYFSSSWLHGDLLSMGSWSWMKDKAQKRLSEIRYHLQGLGSLQEGKVPEQVQSRLRDEEAQLSRLLH